MEWVDRNWYGMGRDRDLPCLFLSDAFIISLPCTNWLKTIWTFLGSEEWWFAYNDKLDHITHELLVPVKAKWHGQNCDEMPGDGCARSSVSRVLGGEAGAGRPPCAGHCWVEAPVLSSPQRVFPSYTAAPSVEQRSPAGRESAVLSPVQRSQHSDLQWHQWACQQCDY